MRFLQNDLGNAVAPLAIGVEFERLVRGSARRKPRSCVNGPMRHGTTEIAFIVDPRRLQD
jgi:hypothetical protein